MFNSEFTPEELDQFHRAYMTAALWSSTDDEGEPLDDSHSVDDLTIDCHNTMLNDCKNFTNRYAPLIRRAIRLHPDYSIERAGHDFWLTRNHHGAGFWDRGIGKMGDWLTDVSKTEGGVDLYVGYDNQIYCN